MKYDPTIDYGVKGLTKEKETVYWKFNELIKLLITLSLPSNKQKEIMGYGAVTDEMAIDFETYYTLSFQSYIN